MIILYTFLAIIFVAVLTSAAILLIRPPRWLLDKEGNEIRHERIKVIVLILATGIGAIWAVHSFITSGQLISYEIQRLHTNPTLHIDFDVREKSFEAATYLIIRVTATNQGRKFTTLMLNDSELLTIGKLATNAEGDFTFKMSEQIQVHVYDSFYHPPSVRLLSNDSSTWRASTVEPGASGTYSFIQRVPEPGIYHIQFKAKLSDRLAKEWRTRSGVRLPKRPVFSTGSVYYLVGRKPPNIANPADTKNRAAD